MPFETYVLLVALAAVIYSGIARFLQAKLINKKEMADIQEESKRLSEEYKAANKSGDKARIDAAMQKQMDLLPKMNSVMFAQFKPLIIILMVFFVFNWAITTYDPSKPDDLSFTLKDDGKGCDKGAADNIYSLCFSMNGTDYGKWWVSARAMGGGSDLGDNTTILLYNVETPHDMYVPVAKGGAVSISLDKQVYYPGDKALITVIPPDGTSEVQVSLDEGTEFYVDLPITIPLLNLQRLYGPSSWFIFVALISGIVISLIQSRLDKSSAGKNTEKKGDKK